MQRKHPSELRHFVVVERWFPRWLLLERQVLNMVSFSKKPVLRNQLWAYTVRTKPDGPEAGKRKKKKRKETKNIQLQCLAHNQ